MQFIKPDINIDIIGKRKIAFVFSALLILISIASLLFHGGPKYGIDFAGGTVIQLKFAEAVAIDDIKKGLAGLKITNPSVQSFGEKQDHEYLVRTDMSENTGEGFTEKLKENLRESTGIPPYYKITDDVLKEMKEGGIPENIIGRISGLAGEKDIPAEEFGKGLAAQLEADDLSRHQTAIEKYARNDVDIRRIEMVGPQVGKDLREKALFAMFYALLFITIYISGRFELKWLVSGIVAAALIAAVYLFSRIHVSIPFLIFTALIFSLVLFWFLELKYAMGAIVALIHDVTITVGVFSLFGKEFSLPIIAALLTIIGYSLNDTIIVFDRIRENMKKFSRDSLEIIINRSINETLSRTILTSSTTLVVVIALFVLGGGIIHDFAFALIVGVAIGTYSSIYVASPILLAWQAFGQKR